MAETRKFLKETEGQAMWEYILLVAVGLSIIAAVVYFFSAVRDKFTEAGDTLRGFSP